MRALPCLLLIALPGLAAAAPLAETHFARNFCWEESWGAAALAANPGQRVSWLQLRREPLGTPRAPGRVAMELRLRVVGEGGPREAVADCRQDDDRLNCVLDSGGGDFRLDAAGEDGVKLTVGAQGMTLEGGREDLKLRGDEGQDREFTLGRCG